MSDTSKTPIEYLLANARLRRYEPGTTVVHTDENADTLYYVVEGSVSVAISNADGQEMVLSYLGKGEFFCELGLFEQGAGNSTVTTREVSTIAQISYAAFRRLIEQEPGILFELTRQMAERLRKTSRKVARQTFVDVTSRIAYQLMDLARQADAVAHPEGKLVRISRQELSRLVGCSREMAGRAVSELEAKGLVSVSGRSIVVRGVTARPGGGPHPNEPSPDDSLVRLPVLDKHLTD
jgi:CRP/FNR family cyclic AMP-dependent transcriptional regulator